MTPEHETPHAAHATGHRWLDLTLALSAMFISLVSLGVAIHHGRAMDRLVNANSWPFLTYGTDNQDAEGQRRIALKIDNAGVGPARIETFELWWQGQPVASADELLRRCCMPDGQPPINSITARSMDMGVGIIAPSVMRAGGEQSFLTLGFTDANAAIWHRLDVARLRITMRACYCSVFDECWETNLWQTSTREVRSCPAVKVPFTVPAGWFESPAAAPAPAAATSGH
jgi:hypothetical protein